VQTFLPYPSFEQSAKVLDRSRLCKQRVECKQIYLSLTVPGYGWKSHPCVRSWAGHEQALIAYACEICREWRARGYKDTLLDYFTSLPCDLVILPKWYGKEDFFNSHKSNLVRKDPGHYRQFFPDIPDNLPYVWPV
jgi:hypothetical protein